MSWSREMVEAVARSRARFSYLGNNAVLAVVMGKYRMVLDSRDRGIVPHLCLDGFWESWVTAWVLNNVKSGERALNLGANCGYYTMILADLVGSEGRVLAVEPSPAHAANIWYSAHLNGYLPSLDIFEGVVGEKDGSAMLDWYPGMTMDARVRYEGAPSSPDQVKLTASKVEMMSPMKRADQLVEDWPSVDFALVDTEGAEPMVFEGLTETIERNPRFRALIEFSPGRYSDPAGFVSWLTEWGFAFGVLGLDAQVTPTRSEVLLDGTERMVLLSRP